MLAVLDDFAACDGAGVDAGASAAAGADAGAAAGAAAGVFAVFAELAEVLSAANQVCTPL